MKSLHRVLLLLFLVLFLAGCLSPDQQDNKQSSDPSSELVGRWRIMGQSTSRYLELNAGGTWQFGSSSGTWSVETMTEEEKTLWGALSPSATRKIVLDGWSGSIGEGPIEESATIAGAVDFIYVLYEYTDPNTGVTKTSGLKFSKVS